MPIKTGEYLDAKDIYIDYEFEEVFFRRECTSKKIYRKFYGEDESKEIIPFDNRLYTDAILYGEEITEEEYLTGKQQHE